VHWLVSQEITIFCNDMIGMDDLNEGW